MEKRKLGNTDIHLTLLGMGGFHLVELASREVSRLLNLYLDKGGNYVETAAAYGKGVSEKKVGNSISARRSEFVLATKSMERSREAVERSLNNSLKHLKTDYVDLFFIHRVQNDDELSAVLSTDGAVRAAEDAQKAGKIRYIGITGHGRQKTMEKALERYPFDVAMTVFNYLDRFNYPDIEEKLLPRAVEKGVGFLAMKALADGYLYRSYEQAIRYVLSLPITCLVLGMNKEEYMEKDFAVAEKFVPLSDAEREMIYKEAPELGRYVCRLCGECREDGFDPCEYFILEGVFDRQMDDRTTPDSSHYAMREYLRFWFRQFDEAKAEYARLRNKIDPDADYSYLNNRCPYGIDIDRKLKIVHDKLGGDEFMY